MNDDEPGEIFIGPIGPIRVVRDTDPQFIASRKASLIAQAAVECDDLVALVLRHPDPLVRMGAVPRLKARFPSDPRSQQALVQAVHDSDDGVRCEAISAVADLKLPAAGDLLASALTDPEADVRFFAAIGLQELGDSRAPDDPETFAYRRT